MKIADDVIGVGSTVYLVDDDGDFTVKIVSEKADIHRDEISPDSPLGKALIGRRVGEEVRIVASFAARKIRIVQIN